MALPTGEDVIAREDAIPCVATRGCTESARHLCPRCERALCNRHARSEGGRRSCPRCRRTFTAPLLLRIVRSSMLDVIGLDYLRTARAKGVSEWLVIGRHALKNAALPLVTVTGLQFGLLLGGAVITETVFAVPGVGRLIVGAIRQLDFPVVQAGVFMLAMIVVSVNFAIDLLYVYLNPQIRVR